MLESGERAGERGDREIEHREKEREKEKRHITYPGLDSGPVLDTGYLHQPALFFVLPPVPHPRSPDPTDRPRIQDWTWVQSWLQKRTRDEAA